MKKCVYVSLLTAVFGGFLFLSGGCSRSSKQINISFWTHKDSNRQKLENRYIREFLASHPNVTVSVNVQEPEKLIDILQAGTASGKGPTIFNLPISEEYAYIKSGLVAPLDYKAAGYKDEKDVIAAYVPGTLSPVIHNRKIYGLPLEITNWAIFVNKKIFRDAGLNPDTDMPQTWEDMMAVSKKIVLHDGDMITRRGYDFRYKYDLENTIPMVEQLGGKLISDDGKEALVGKEAWLHFLGFMQQWGPHGENLGSPAYPAARKQFNQAAGNIAMCSTGLYQEARIKSENPDFYNSDDWAVIPYPVFKDAITNTAACYYGHYYMVNASADKETRQMAWSLIAYMLSHSEEYLKEVNIIQPTNKLMQSSLYQSLPFSAVFTNDMKRSHIVYFGQNSYAIRNALDLTIQAVMLQNISPETAYTELKQKIQELIREQ